jgi:predicted nucleic acid-binding protein
MIVLDTSCLIRFLTKDDPKKASSVKKLIEGEKQLAIPDVVFPELEYVLQTETYNASRTNVLKSFKFLTTQKNIQVSKSVKIAVGLYENTKLDMADCLIAAAAINEKGKMASFDNELLKTPGITSHSF